MLEHVVQLVGSGTEIGVNVVDDRLLVQVVADHRRHIGVDELVVGHAGARGIGDRHPSGAHHIDQARYAEHRIAAEHLGVEEVVIDAAVDHVHGFPACRAAHPDATVFTDQIAALHQGNSHLLGEVAVLEIGAVEHARGEQHHPGCITPGGEILQGAQQMGWIVVNRLHRASGKQAREQPLHHPPVLEKVGHS